MSNMLLEMSREKVPDGMKRGSQNGNNTQLWMRLVMKVKSDAARAILHRTWNVRSMNRSKLEVVKQEIARVSIDILGIKELKWDGMSEFNSDDHYIYYCGQESLRRNGVTIIVNKRV